MNRVNHSTLVNGITRELAAKNYMIACGPDYDPYRDVVIFTVTYHGEPIIMDNKMDKIAEIEREYRQNVVAVVYNDQGEVWDYAFNWESAQNYALSNGYRVAPTVYPAGPAPTLGAHRKES